LVQDHHIQSSGGCQIDLHSGKAPPSNRRGISSPFTCYMYTFKRFAVLSLPCDPCDTNGPRPRSGLGATRQKLCTSHSVQRVSHLVRAWLFVRAPLLPSPDSSHDVQSMRAILRFSRVTCSPVCRSSDLCIIRVRAADHCLQTFGSDPSELNDPLSTKSDLSGV
jgi:hypothetical protein